MRKKLWVFIMLTSFFLSGCWDSMELNNIAIVTGIAIDPGEDKKYKLTLGYVNSRQFSKQNPEQGAPSTVMTLEGDSLPEISSRMNIGVSRRLIFSHTRIVYINEKVAREGVGPFLDEIERSPQFRNDFNILVTKGDEAKKFTEMNDNLEKIPSLKVQKQIKTLVEGWGGDPKVRLSDFIKAIVSKGRSPVTSVVIISGDPEKGKSVESNMLIETPANILLDGMAVFKKDKLIGFLTLADTRNYMWTQDLKNTMVNIPCNSNEEAEDKQYFDLVITNNKSTLNVDYQGEVPKLRVNIYSEARLNSMQCPEDLSKIKTYEELEKRANKHIENMIEGTIKKVQKEYGLDIFGFGEVLHRKHYQKAKEVENDWDKEFARADVEVKVELAIRRTGTRNKGFMTMAP